MNYFKLFLIWRSFVKWFRSLFILVGLQKSIDWIKKIQDLTQIANDALDQQQKPKKRILQRLLKKLRDR